MCGRVCCSLTPEEVRLAAQLPPDGDWIGESNFEGRYNVPPGDRLPCLRLDPSGKRYLCTLSFGIPSPEGRLRINARVENLQSYHEWRRLLHDGRCIAFCRGYFEWKTEDDGRKRPYYVHSLEGSVMAMAALCDNDGHAVLVTADACDDLRWLHSRMPCLLPRESDLMAWLKCEKSAATSSRGDGLRWHAVVRKVGHISFEGPECIASLDAEKERKDLEAWNKNERGKKRPPLDPKQQLIHRFFPPSTSKKSKKDPG